MVGPGVGSELLDIDADPWFRVKNRVPDTPVCKFKMDWQETYGSAKKTASTTDRQWEDDGRSTGDHQDSILYRVALAESDERGMCHGETCGKSSLGMLSKQSVF